MKKLQKVEHWKMFAAIGIALLFILQIAGLTFYQSRLGSLQAEIDKRDMKLEYKTTEDLRAEFYNTESATLFSPHTLRLKMDKGEIDFILIDVRAAEDYNRGHIRGAINIPFDSSEESIDKFKQAMEEGKAERKSYAITYCYSYACMLGAKTGKELAKHGISVMELSVGYNDWEMQHRVWNNIGEIYDIEDYIERSDQPGTLEPSQDFLNRPCGESSEFSC